MVNYRKSYAIAALIGLVVILPLAILFGKSCGGISIEQWRDTLIGKTRAEVEQICGKPPRQTAMSLTNDDEKNRQLLADSGEKGVRWYHYRNITVVFGLDDRVVDVEPVEDGGDE